MELKKDYRVSNYYLTKDIQFIKNVIPDKVYRTKSSDKVPVKEMSHPIPAFYQLMLWCIFGHPECTCELRISQSLGRKECTYILAASVEMNRNSGCWKTAASEE